MNSNYIWGKSMKFHDFKVILQLKFSLIQDSFLYWPLSRGVDDKLWVYANDSVECGKAFTSTF